MMFKNSLHHKSPLGLAILSLALHGSVWQSQAQITLHDQNSTAQIDPHSQAGMFHWDIQGQNELVQQWFWYRIGPAGPERSLDTISPAAVSPFLGSRGVAITYTGPQFSIETDYTLTGGAPAPPGQIGQADMGESIRINNLTGTTLDFHFFQYSD